MCEIFCVCFFVGGDVVMVEMIKKSDLLGVLKGDDRLRDDIVKKLRDIRSYDIDL